MYVKNKNINQTKTQRETIMYINLYSSLLLQVDRSIALIIRISPLDVVVDVVSYFIA